ncbi:hypothetical protein [Pseudidiomarina sp.]|uniref:hypothetical protein n=1 Tax=Pseudidiomarina sp. TaxID=2081707 RepID=UPI003A96FC3A
MNSTLKAAGHIGAELGAAKAECERLRTALKDLIGLAEDQICQHHNTHRGGAIWEICDDCGMKWADDMGGRPEFMWPDEIESARTALSQQAEPNDTYTATDMATAAAQGFRDGQAATVKDSLTVQPMAYAVFAANGNVACFSTQRDHPSLVALEADGHSVVSLAPIAQTAPHSSKENEGE